MDYYGPEYYEEMSKWDEEHKTQKLSYDEFMMLLNEKV